MELPQPRPLGGEGGRNKATHDFLSLYSSSSHSTSQQDPSPPSQGGYIETHDFLQLGKAKEETSVEIVSPRRGTSSVEHILPGGIGTYSISHISYFNQKVPKPEENVFPVVVPSSGHERNEENSNCSSYAGSGFTLWDAKKGKTGKENVTGFRGELRVQVDGNSSDQKANTPRSKHSATEQRRRSKINDRFQMLRELIPHSDQKRDKASFLLEVIEYIQYLQEKVTKYEVPYQGWNQDAAKSMPWQGNNQKPGAIYCDLSRDMNGGSVPALVFAAAKVEENNSAASPIILGRAQTPVESDTSIETTFKPKDHHSGMTNKAVPFPMSMQSNFLTHVRSSSAAPPFPPRLPSEVENTSSHPHSMLFPMKSCPVDTGGITDKLKEHELTIEGGRINISRVYSQGLLNSLTQALQNSGVNLSQASISVQIELGKQACSRMPLPKSVLKENEIPSMTPGNKHSRMSLDEDSKQSQKKLRTS